MPMPPETNERPAWKDTIKTYAGYITRVIQRFDLPRRNTGDNPAKNSATSGTATSSSTKTMK